MKYTMGHLLALVRAALGLSQDSLADKLLVSKSIISRYETGERNLSKARLEVICHKLGLSKKLVELLIADTVSTKNKDIAKELGLILLTRLSQNPNSHESHSSK
ncbi:MAG: helix-turn-helix transcriptional regulator [Candidatus Paceibacterota bacterium]|jgi:transcriptional regulator with XRE-family HTH domain